MDKLKMVVRTADPKKEPVAEKLQSNVARNSFDPSVLNYPGTVTLCAENGKIQGYMPVQPVAVLESVWVEESLNAFDAAAVVTDMVKGAILLAYEGDIREMMFLASDEATAHGARHLGFEELNFKVFRLRLPHE